MDSVHCRDWLRNDRSAESHGIATEFRIISSLPGILIGTSIQVLAAGVTGLIAAAVGMALGMVLLLPFYAIRAMGAGDVKLMGMVGVFLGPSEVLSVAVTFMAGGVLALLVALQTDRWVVHSSTCGQCCSVRWWAPAPSQSGNRKPVVSAKGSVRRRHRSRHAVARAAAPVGDQRIVTGNRFPD